jgi:aminoglycoside phosphotransferase (APT) family kinase protein
MDLRSTNVCVKDGHIAALIDVANCIVGDPLMELGRIRGYGLLNGAFRAGYGLDHFSPAESALLDIYELDTALLLTVVSVEEFDDPVLHHDQSARATHLAARIAKSL